MSTVRKVTFLSLAAFIIAVSGCGDEDANPRADEAISKELFIEAYVELRQEGLRSPMTEISLEDRDRILEELGVTEEDLFTFVDVWGTDGDFMVEVWETIDSLMTEDRMMGRPGRPESEEENPEGTGDSRRGSRGVGQP
jgi:hypothetical protein